MLLFNLRICLCSLAISIFPGITQAAVSNFSFTGIVENSRRYYVPDNDPANGVPDGEYSFFTEVMPFVGSLDIDDQLFGAITTRDNSVYIQPLKFDFNIDRFSGGFGFSSTSPCMGFQTVDNNTINDDPAAIFTTNKIYDRVRYEFYPGLTPCDSDITELNNGYKLYQINLHALDTEDLGSGLPDMLSNSRPKSDISSLIGSADTIFFELVFEGARGPDRRNFASVIGQIQQTSQIPEPTSWLALALGMAGIIRAKRQRAV
jgi:hypothetical protein